MALTDAEKQIIIKTGDALIDELPALLAAEVKRIPGFVGVFLLGILPVVIPGIVPALKAWFDAQVEKA